MTAWQRRPATPQRCAACSALPRPALTALSMCCPCSNHAVAASACCTGGRSAGRGHAPHRRQHPQQVGAPCSWQPWSCGAPGLAVGGPGCGRCPLCRVLLLLPRLLLLSTANPPQPLPCSARAGMFQNILVGGLVSDAIQLAAVRRSMEQVKALLGQVGVAALASRPPVGPPLLGQRQHPPVPPDTGPAPASTLLFETLPAGPGQPELGHTEPDGAPAAGGGAACAGGRQAGGGGGVPAAGPGCSRGGGLAYHRCLRRHRGKPL